MSLNFNGNYIGGVPSGGGGGTPYILPVASTTTLGGVKIDGTSITINDGVISSTGGGSITVDSALSDSSENPVQNKVINTALGGKQATIDANNKLSVSLVDGGLNTDASNLTSTGQKVFDGQWVASKARITNDYETYPTTEDVEYDISQYLPNDSANYEVIISGAVHSGTQIGDYCRIELSSDIFPSIIIADAQSVVSGQPSACSSATMVPVGAQRKIKIFHLSWAKGKYSLWISGYRRIGTNQ